MRGVCPPGVEDEGAEAAPAMAEEFRVGPRMNWVSCLDGRSADQNLVVAEGACITSTVLEDDAGDNNKGGVCNCTG